MSRSLMLFRDPTKVDLKVTRMSYKNTLLVKIVLRAGKNVQQKCHIKLFLWYNDIWVASDLSLATS